MFAADVVKPEYGTERSETGEGERREDPRRKLLTRVPGTRI